MRSQFQRVATLGDSESAGVLQGSSTNKSPGWHHRKRWDAFLARRPEHTILHDFVFYVSACMVLDSSIPRKNGHKKNPRCCQVTGFESHIARNLTRVFLPARSLKMDAGVNA